MNKDTVDIIFPVRNRAAYLPTFLNNIYNLDYPKNLISFHICINDSLDDTDRILYKFQKEHKDEYNIIDIYTYNLGSPIYGEGARGGIETVNTRLNNGMIRTKEINTANKVYKNLARLRNGLLNKCTSNYILSVDTDIMLKSDSLMTLINNIKESEYSLVSALICNGFEIADKFNCNPYIYTNIMRKNGEGYTHIQDYNDKGLLEVDLTGAVMVITKEACKSGAKFSESFFGEDAAFSNDLQQRGFKLACNCQHRLAHCMNTELLNKYLEGKFTF